MRLSTSIIFSLGSQAMLQQQARVAQAGEQLSSGKRINRPSDDPQSASQLVMSVHAQQVAQQYTDSRATARDQLSTEEGALNQVADALGQVKQTLIQAGNGALNANDRQILGAQLRSMANQLLAAANTKDNAGKYIFGGTRDDTLPFAKHTVQVAITIPAQGGLPQRDLTVNVETVSYQGDDNPPTQIQVSGSRSVAVNDSGKRIFSTNDGTNDFANILSQIFVAADTLDPLADGSQVLANVTRNDSSTPLDPAAQGVASSYAANLINGGANLTALLGTGDPINMGDLTGLVNNAQQQADQATNQVLAVRADLGNRMSALDNLDDAAALQSINDATQISRLRDADLTAVIPQFALAQTALQAAEKSFLSIQGLSLFAGSSNA